MKISILVYCNVKDKKLIKNCIAKLKEHTTFNFNLILIKDLISNNLANELKKELLNVFICQLSEIKFYIDGDIICCIENDVQVTVKWTERLIKHLDNADIVGACCNEGGLNHYNITDKKIDLKNVDQAAENIYNENKNTLELTEIIFPYCFIMKRSVYQKLGIFNPAQYRYFFKSAVLEKFNIGIAKDTFVFKNSNYDKKNLYYDNEIETDNNDNSPVIKQTFSSTINKKRKIGFITVTYKQPYSLIQKNRKNIVKNMTKFDTDQIEINDFNKLFINNNNQFVLNKEQVFNEYIIHLAKAKCDIIACVDSPGIIFENGFFNEYYDDFLYKMKWYVYFSRTYQLGISIASTKAWFVLGGWNNLLCGCNQIVYQNLISRIKYLKFEFIEDNTITLEPDISDYVSGNYYSSEFNSNIVHDNFNNFLAEQLQ